MRWNGANAFSTSTAYSMLIASGISYEMEGSVCNSFGPTKIILLARLMVNKVNTKQRLIRKECQLMMHSVTLCRSGSRGRNIAVFFYDSKVDLSG